MAYPRIALYRENEGRSDVALPATLQNLALRELDRIDAQDCDLLVRWDGEHLSVKDLRVRGSRWLTAVPSTPKRRRARKGLLAQAVGPRSNHVVDATAGWGGDSVLLYEMGYVVTAMERHSLIAAMLQAGFSRLSAKNLPTPKVVAGDARRLLREISPPPDCVYMDPMFPPKKKATALPRRSLLLLRELVGDDDDVETLFETALAVCRRVVVKRPDDGAPLGRRPDTSFGGKLVRYDVYFSTPKPRTAN